MRCTACDDVVGVQRGEDEVAGLGGGERRRHRLEVAHLPHQDDVGVLAQAGAQRGGERRRVGAHLDLLDEALAAGVLVLDGVLDGDDVRRRACG